MIRRLFLDHPSSVGEGYFEHQQVALSFAVELIAAGLACLVHALIPGLCLTTGSRAIARLHQRMIVNRARRLRSDEVADAGAAVSATSLG
jgi:hypothetical protein